MPAQPPTPPPVLPPVQRTSIPNERRPAADVVNPFERTAALLVDTLEDHGQRLAQNTNEQPADSVPLDRDKLKDMWYFSPAPNAVAADALFWQTHDQVLQQTGDHQQAEQQAMQAAYPYRSKLIGAGVASAQKQVDDAERLRKLIDGDQAPDSAEASQEIVGRGIRLKEEAGHLT
jgi:hypothetical protein